MFNAPNKFDEQTLNKKWKPEHEGLVLEFISRVSALTEFNALGFEEIFNAFIQEKGMGVGQFLPVLRLLLTGVGAGPSLFTIAEMLGKQETLDRLSAGITKAKSEQHA
jgi:glutamyl-tRNA synthetase